jgi:hypothetical protein
MADSTPSETLRAAAVRLRELATAATAGPWEIEYNCGGTCAQAVFRMDPEHPDDVDFSISLGGMNAAADNVWVVTMDPAVAEPLAAWLCQEAAWHDTQIFRTSSRHHALAFAHSILEQPNA